MIKGWYLIDKISHIHPKHFNQKQKNIYIDFFKFIFIIFSRVVPLKVWSLIENPKFWSELRPSKKD